MHNIQPQILCMFSISYSLFSFYYSSSLPLSLICPFSSISLSLLQIREPPVADGKGGSPTRKESKLPKFADWAQGNMPQLDADAVKKHVAKMVDVS